MNPYKDTLIHTANVLLCMVITDTLCPLKQVILGYQYYSLDL